MNEHFGIAGISIGVVELRDVVGLGIVLIGEAGDEMQKDLGNSIGAANEPVFSAPVKPGGLEVTDFGGFLGAGPVVFIFLKTDFEHYGDS